jgi:hypothetical protein
MRIATIVAAALFTAGGLSAAERASASITQHELNIPRQPLDTALKDLARRVRYGVAYAQPRTFGLMFSQKF